MKIKKIFVALATIVIVVISASMIAAFEAHVINVTAQIENALRVPIDHITFGTVFPQEELEKNIDIKLSQSFIDEPRVDDVEYIIRQKPKCGWTNDNGSILVDLPTMTGHVGNDGIATCPPAPTDVQVPTGATWGQLPLLCPYLSKHKAGSDPDANQNELEVDAFHKPWEVVGNSVIYNEAKGRLAKSESDTEDSWTIDLKVPCFGNYCAQDWEEFVRGINSNAIPSEYVQDIADEHKVFGCDLWIEVVKVSEENGDVGCMDKADVMLVLDRSGSVLDELPLLKTAAKNFVNTLVSPASDVFMGQTSFSTNGSLDTHLTSNMTTLNANIDALVSSGRTNLAEGLSLAAAELANPGDTHDRADADSADYVVVITDGAPNEPGASEASGKAAATAAANAARAAGAKIYVVGVGTDTATASYLSNNIANHTGQYYDVADYSGLSAVLNDIASCDSN